jgi:hypothetical protein
LICCELANCIHSSIIDVVVDSYTGIPFGAQSFSRIVVELQRLANDECTFEQ